MKTWMFGALALSVTLAACGGSDGGSNSTTGGGNTSGTTGSNQACSSANCAGCCFNGQCQTGTAASACGKSGAACSACGAAEICKTDQTCGVDPESTWLVQPTTAVFSSTDANGDAWDALGGAPDPFATITCPPSTTPNVGTTPTVNDSFTPTWTSGGCTAKASALLAEPIAFRLFDEDVSSDDFIGGVQAQLTESALEQGGGTITCAAPDCTSLVSSFTLKITKQ